MARRRAEPEHENHERWLVSYADFITLLFAFFTVLYATSQHDVKKEEEFEKAIRKYLNGETGFGAADGNFNTNNENRSLIEPPITTFPPMSAGPKEIKDYVERTLKKDMKKEDYKEVVQNVRHDSVGARIQLAAAAIFESGSSELKPMAIESLAALAELLRNSNRRIIIEGHTDNEPVHNPKFPSNWELSALRAAKVLRVLERDHVDPKKMAAIAYADQKPIDTNDTPEGRAKNRRIEILIVQGSEE